MIMVLMVMVGGDTVVFRWMKRIDLLGSRLADSSHWRERCPQIGMCAALLVIVQHLSVFPPAASCLIFTYTFMFLFFNTDTCTYINICIFILVLLDDV